MPPLLVVGRHQRSVSGMQTEEPHTLRYGHATEEVARIVPVGVRRLEEEPGGSTMGVRKREIMVRASGKHA